jgi:mRNA interferase RelE/StbE
MAHVVFFQPAARRELAAIQPADRKRVLSAIESLADDPRPSGCAKMSGFRDIWRIRVGVYRVIYRLENRMLTVEIIRIGHRREVYRGL